MTNSTTLLWASAATALLGAHRAEAQTILSLDASRTGNESRIGDDRYLTSASMVDATQILLNAGFAIQTTSLFTAANITGTDVLYTGAVDVAFTAQELTDVAAYVMSGGGLVIQRDWGQYYPAADPLASAFGITYGTSAQGPPGTPTAVNMSAAHEIWNGPAGSATTYFQAYSSSVVSGATIIGTHSVGGAGAIAVKDFGAGRVVVLTDMDAWDSAGDATTPLASNDNGVVWENIFHWVSGGNQPAIFAYCFGTGCPCGNDDAGAGCTNSTGSGALLVNSGTISVAIDDFALTVSNVPANQFGILFMGGAQTTSLFGNGLLCVAAGAAVICRFPPHNSGAGGTIMEGPGLIAHTLTLQAACHILPGQTWKFQGWYRDPGGPCGASFNLSNALSVTFFP